MRFDAQQLVTFRPVGTLTPCAVTVHREGNWAIKNVEQLKCGLKMTFHRSTGYEEEIQNF